MRSNRTAHILNIEKPAVQRPLSQLIDTRLVMAAGNAGGFDVLGPNAGLTATTAVSTPEVTAEEMHEETRKTEQLMKKPFDANLILTAKNDIWTPAILPVIKGEGVKAMVYIGHGDDSLKPALSDELKAAGITIIYRGISPTPENNRRTEQTGADIIVAIGSDEGGMLPGTIFRTFTIVSLIIDAVQRAPVMAAGGIIDVRGAYAVRTLGAEGALAGLAFTSTIESRVPDLAKARIVTANGPSLYLFRTLSDYYRVLPGRLSDALVAVDRVDALKAELIQAMGGLRGIWLDILEGNTDRGYTSVDTRIGNIHATTPVARMVNQLAVRSRQSGLGNRRDRASITFSTAWEKVPITSPTSVAVADFAG